MGYGQLTPSEESKRSICSSSKQSLFSSSEMELKDSYIYHFALLLQECPVIDAVNAVLSPPPSENLM